MQICYLEKYIMPEALKIDFSSTEKTRNVHLINVIFKLSYRNYYLYDILSKRKKNDLVSIFHDTLSILGGFSVWNGFYLS